MYYFCINVLHDHVHSEINVLTDMRGTKNTNYDKFYQHCFILLFPCFNEPLDVLCVLVIQFDEK